MRRFVYYNNSGNPINGEPTTPPHYYNYMNGIWKNGQKMTYGGNGITGSEAFMPEDMKTAPEIVVPAELKGAAYVARTCPPEASKLYTAI